MAVHDFRSQRLFIDAPLEKGKPLEASREQANYLLNVLRLGQNAQILVFNGRDGEWRCGIDVAGRKKCCLIPLVQNRPQPEPFSLIYCFAPLKQARLDYMVQKAVEMGAGTLLPVITRHTQVRNINDKRLVANAIEAAEQCGILSIPTILAPVTLERMDEILPLDCSLVFCDEDAPGMQEIADIKRQSSDPLAVLIGPEGGFCEAERQALAGRENTYRLGLGPRILRADTAAVAALAAIQATIGDWYDRPDTRKHP